MIFYKLTQDSLPYWQLLTALEPKLLKLTAVDNEIYQQFRKEFPDLKLDFLNVDEIKSKDSKAVST